ncbi:MULTISPECIES: fibronectin type III domain-containing protein [unclassified Paenibacillus]|uniref:fibronectin type III domain-containing protein n=1 Tax=unclassified Paenibacillus TaxID=185978 RepID=UPI00363716D0
MDAKYVQIRNWKKTGLFRNSSIVILIIMFLQYSVPWASDQVHASNYWEGLGTGVEGRVDDIAVSGSSIYIGGHFVPNGDMQTKFIAKWDGTAWSSLGGGVDGAVHAVAVSGSDVYAGGLFVNAGGSPASHIAKWNGSTWQSLSSGLYLNPGSSTAGTVEAIAVSGTDVYAGGTFTAAGGSTANYIAKWNGSAWQSLGSGLNGEVRAIAVSGSDVYVGGFFTTAGGSPAKYIARWDGSSWHNVGSGFNDGPNVRVETIKISGTDIYVGGNFTGAGDVPLSHIAKWDGSTWKGLGTGLSDTVWDLAVSGKDVYAGGVFMNAGPLRVKSVAKWNGSTAAWESIGGLGTDVEAGFAYAVTKSATGIYVGGQFTVAGGIPANYMAKWVTGITDPVVTKPDPPTGVTAAAGKGLATVSFTPPANNGGGAITGYTVTSSPGGFAASGTASPITVTGLTYGMAYTFTVTASNEAGTSVPSAPSGPVTPDSTATVPDPPTGISAAASNQSATVSFTPPANNGGSTITSYTVTSNPGGLTASGARSPITVTGLTYGTAYTFTVTATNGIGTSIPSTPSGAVSPGGPAAIVPDSPTGVSAAAGNQSATVNFIPPLNNGSSEITNYTVTSNPDGLSASGNVSPITINGLNNGVSYTFTVTATNGAGTSAPSSASASVTPRFPSKSSSKSSGSPLVIAPEAPTEVSAATGDGSAVVSFTPPTSNGGSAITGYTVTSSPGGLTASGTDSPIAITGLTNGTAYTFTVTATNGAGTSISSAASASVTPVPSAPAVLQHKAYISGFPDGTFRPDKSVSRAEIATLLSRVFDKEDQAAAKVYTDVESGYWGKAAIDKVTRMGLMQGYENDAFGPDRSVSHAEIAIIVDRLNIRKDEVEKMLGRNSTEAVTRAEAVTILCRLLGRLPLSGAAQKWSDVPQQHGNYEYIQEASIDHAYELSSDGKEHWLPF